MVLRQRGVPVHQPGAANQFLCGAHGQRELAGRAGPRAYGGRCTEFETLEGIIAR